MFPQTTITTTTTIGDREVLCCVQEPSMLTHISGRKGKISRSQIALAVILFCVSLCLSLLVIKAYQAHRKRVQLRKLLLQQQQVAYELPATATCLQISLNRH